MTAIEAFVTRHPVRIYFALAFAVSWAGVLFVVGPGGIPTTIEHLMTIGPAMPGNRCHIDPRGTPQPLSPELHSDQTVDANVRLPPHTHVESKSHAIGDKGPHTSSRRKRPFA